MEQYRVITERKEERDSSLIETLQIFGFIMYLNVRDFRNHGMMRRTCFTK